MNSFIQVYHQAANVVVMLNKSSNMNKMNRSSCGANCMLKYKLIQ